MDRPLSAGDALALLGDGLDPDAVGPFDGPSVLAVAVDDDIDGLQRVAAISRHRPCVAVGVGDGRPVSEKLAAGFDVFLTDRADALAPWVTQTGDAGGLRGLVGAVEQSPAAAVALVQLLRMGEGLSILDAIIAESFVYGLLQAGPEFAAWLATRPAKSAPRPADNPVLVTRDDGRLVITLNRPDVRNAYDAATRDALVEALRLVVADPGIEAVELRGAGPSFCSGGDLTEFGTHAGPVAAHLLRSTRSAATWLSFCADRVTAHVQGACVGAGIELAAFAARVVAAADARFVLPEVGMGLVPGAGGTASIPRRIGRHRAAWLALSGAALDAPTALAWGLVDEVV